jgi:NADH-ubiquinone oxidoreductase chain 3
LWDRVVYLVFSFFLLFLVREEFKRSLDLLLIYFFFFFFVFFFCVVLVFFFYLLNFFVSTKINKKRKISSFESGFVRVGLVQGSFSVHFFLIILIFIIFDVEIVILLGFLIRSLVSFFRFFLVFFFILGGLYLEWFFNKLDWVL